MTKSSYLAIDPGETTGWATFDSEGNVIRMGQFSMAKLNEELTELVHSELKQVIIEDYKNFAWKQQKKWSQNQTSKNIGKIELLCDLRSVPFFLQPASVKSIGYRWAGLDGPPSNHAISHQWDAYVHGVYWLQKMGIRPVGKAILNGP